MKTVVIYQAPFEQTALGFNRNADYVVVWAEECLDNINLEKIWKKFQRIDDDNMPPEDYTGLSASCECAPNYEIALGQRELAPANRLGCEEFILADGDHITD